MKKFLLSFFYLIFLFGCTDHRTPLQKSNYDKLTSHSEMIEYLNELSHSSLIDLDTLAVSKGGKDIPFLKVSSSRFGDDSSKIKVMIFAQQHGNEHSGKEALISLAKRIYESKITYLLSRMDLLIVPQMNPDGSEINKRENGNNADLNRDHLILQQPETIGLHKLFNKYLPQVTLDVHEYNPYTEEWKNFGYQKKWDQQFGTLTNLNISQKIIESQKQKFIPFIKNYLEERNFTFNEYVVGGPQSKDMMRFSTVDINDGRQSLGILNTYSFILEGLNGRNSLENIEHRVDGQIKSILGFLEFVYQNKNEIINLIDNSRNKLSRDENKISIGTEYSKGDGDKHLALFDLKNNKDTSLHIENFFDKVVSTVEVSKPKAYLIPKNEVVKTWLENHNIKFTDDFDVEKVYQYQILNTHQEDLETVSLEVEKIEVSKFDKNAFFYIPLNQIHSNMLVLSLEPQSQIGLIQYSNFQNIFFDGKKYKILRVE